MYSVVLMMAMASGGEAPDCHPKHGCTGCTGAVVVVASGCTGSCTGGHHLFGGGGCTGGHKLFSGKLFAGHGCHGGCTGYGGCTGVIYSGCTGGVPVGVPPGEPIKKMPKEEPKKTGTFAPAPATLIVSLPADAKLIIDETATASTSEQRTFVSPILTPGMDYNYTLKAEVVRNGKTVKVEEKVVVHAGEETRVTLSLPTSVATR
jgi:uncharacterized protein (TIGR03000 family)